MTRKKKDKDDAMDGQDPRDNPTTTASIPIIRELQAQRIATIKSRMRIDNQASALVRRCLGWQMDLPEKEQAKICKVAGQIVKAIQTGKDAPDGTEDVVAAVTAFVVSATKAREPFIEYQKQIEKDMTKLAKGLPVWPWAEAVCGFGALGLAIIVGECGDLGGYSNPAKVWKRMGLAVMGANRQGNPGKNASADEWVAHGYSPRRRSAMWTLGDSLLKKQNEYREIYLSRKAMESERDPDMSKMHAHRRAQRYAEKRLLRNLWRAWRDVGKAAVA